MKVTFPVPPSFERPVLIATLESALDRELETSTSFRAAVRTIASQFGVSPLTVRRLTRNHPMARLP